MKKVKLIFSNNYPLLFKYTLSFYLLLFFTTPSNANLIDKVIAYVDDIAITFSEFKEQRLKTPPSIDNNSLLNLMINNVLIIKEAHKMRLDAKNTEELINVYLDIKIRQSVVIKDSQIEDFYEKEKTNLGDKDFLSIQRDIYKYLFEKEVNNLLKKHLDELRSNANIKILSVD